MPPVTPSPWPSVVPEDAGREPALLSLRGVGKRYREGGQEIVVLDAVSLQLQAGASAGVYGARRSGKSTLLRLAAAIESPDSGTVSFAGADVTRISTRERARLLRRDVALLSGSGWTPVPGESVLDHVATSLGSEGLSLREARRRAMETLDAVGVAALGVRELTGSLGLAERARVLLARALARKPRLLLVDEPAPMPSLADHDSYCTTLRTLASERQIALLIASENLATLGGLGELMSLSAGGLCSSERRDGGMDADGDGDGDEGSGALGASVSQLRPRRAGAS